MRGVPRLAFLGWFFLSAAGCAAISGLSSIEEKDCAPLCGDGESGRDGTSGTDGESSDTTSGVDTSDLQDSPSEVAPSDAPHDGGAGDSSSEAGVPDAPSDAPPEGSSPDAPFDSGCGDLNTVTNCSACGDKCATSVTSETAATCGGDTNGFGASCSYTCAKGFLDCNAASSPPNLDGCECNASGATQASCCGALCPVSHDYDEDVLGATFYDCVAAGTFNDTLATDACGAYAGNASQCDFMYTFSCTAPDGGMAGDMICSDGPNAPACTCWGYDGAIQGQVHVGTGKGTTNPNNCQCPQVDDPHWD